MPSSGGQTCALDRKSTRLNSSHTIISYAVFCLKKKIGQDDAPNGLRSGGLGLVRVPAGARQLPPPACPRSPASRNPAARPPHPPRFFFSIRRRPRTFTLFPPPHSSR